MHIVMDRSGHLVWFPGTELASLQHYAMNPDVAPSHGPRGPFGRPCLLCKSIHFEVSLGESQSRVVVKNEHFVAH
jgi:UDPglucose--hexose-1-phosphate uridylyltransferase